MICPPESAARMNTRKLPPSVGVPEIAPPAIDSPGGRSEFVASCTVYGANPPDGTSGAEYGWPTIPGGSASGVSTSDPTFSVNGTISDCALASVTCSENANEPPAVGRPEMNVPAAPAENSDSPGGSADPASSVHVCGAMPPRISQSSG